MHLWKVHDMHTYERDYRYLLLHLLPRHRLSSARRREIDRALDAGIAADLRRESVRALEELCDAEYSERTGIDSANGDVLIGYRRRDGGYRLTVSVPRGESPGGVSIEPGFAEVESEAAAQRGSAEAAPSVPAASRPVSTETVEAVSYLPEIVRTFAITDRTDPILRRLATLLDTLHRWLDLEGASFDVVENVLGHVDEEVDRVRVVGEDDLRRIPMYARALESGAPQLIPRGQVDTDDMGRAGPWEVLGIVPVFGMGKVYGILRLYFGGTTDNDTMTSQLKVVGGVIHQVIEFHTQIADLTTIDALTGIYNRHFFDAQLPVEVERAMRSGSEVALLLVDIDDFKQINDEIGHKKGDEALSTVAEMIRLNLRKVDIPFRYGGEEIVILLPGTSRFESVHTAERLRQRIGEYDGFLDLRGRARRITVSVGVSVYPETARSEDDLFMQADAAMYRAKELGKNRVVLYSDDMALDRPRE